MSKKPLSSDAELRAAKPGWHTVTGAPGLLFRVEPAKRGGVNRAFVTRLPDEKRSKRGLGPYPLVTLAQARQKDWDVHRAFAEGKDPGVRAQRRQRLAEAQRTLTLIKAIDGAPAPPYKHAKSVEIRERALRRHFSALHSRDVTKITASDVAAILNTLTPQTAIKSHIAIRKVFDYAATMLEPHGVVVLNPADPRRLRAVGWSANPTSESHASVHWRVMPLVVDELDRMDDVAAACVLYTASTAVRAGTARLTKWANIDLAKREWVPPLADLKDGKHHKRPFIVPLSDIAIDVLERARVRSSSPYVFARSSSGPLSDGDISNFIRKLRRLHDDWRDPHSGKLFTIHGFRSALRTWAEETRRADSALAELSLGHKVHGDVATRYIRTGLVEERRALLDAWSRHLRGESAKVIDFKALKNH
jgi:integrase